VVRPRAEMQSPVAAFLFVLLCVNSVCISSALFPVTEDSIVVESDGILDSDAEILTEDDGCTPPPHFPNLRQSYSRTLQHASDSAQGHFSDGLVHFYGFNRIEALRAFGAALACDPKCAMCMWGQALASTPHMNERRVGSKTWSKGVEAARAMAKTADEEGAALSDVEHGLVSAMTARFANAAANSTKEWTPAEYIAAMKALAQKFPDDDDVSALYTDALADSRGYNMEAEGRSVCLPLLAPLVQRGHPLGLHLQIHMTEGLKPGRCEAAEQCAGLCEAAADKLATRVPDAGHLVHMPSHCYMRLGRYADAAAASQRAAEVDQRYIDKGFAPYIPQHNLLSMVAGAVWSGRVDQATQGAQWLADRYQMTGTRFLVLVQFGQWDQVLQTAQAETPTITRAFARAMARAAKGDPDAMKKEQFELKAMAGKAEPGELAAERERVARLEDPAEKAHGNTVLDIADKKAKSHSDKDAEDITGVLLDLVEARGALLGGDSQGALVALERGVDAMDTWEYMEPPMLPMSVRPCLGDLLKHMDKAEDAKAVFKQDLVVWPKSGYALLGLGHADTKFEVNSPCPMMS